MFDRKRQAYLLTAIKWCSDNFANFMDDRRRVNKSFGELFYNFHFIMLIQRVGTKSILEMELPIYTQLVYSTKMFRKNMNSGWINDIGFINLRASNSERHEK